LLDAQVEVVLAKARRKRLNEAIARDLADLLELADELVVAEAVSRDQVKATAHEHVAVVGDSPLIELMATQIADAVYVLAARRPKRFSYLQISQA
jgi:ribosomal silencing factor RsfS